MSITNILSGFGGLEKLKITSFPDSEYKTGTAIESYVVMYNPTSYQSDYRIVWAKPAHAGAQDVEMAYLRQNSEGVTFEFLFDATAASPPGANVPGEMSSKVTAANTINAIDTINKEKHVEGAIAEFFRMTQKVQGDTHQPNFLQINWGAFEFRGVLESATVAYKLFNASGLPIRASVTANFKKSISRPEQAKDPSTSSPDLTHYRFVEEGTTLPLMTSRIYNDPLLYLEVARVNNLQNFRRLKAGQRLALPPVDKKTK
jgi:hypothetical protein